MGIDIGSTTIKIAGISQKGKDLKLHFYDVLDLVETYSLKSLEDLNDDLYIEQLRKLVSKYHVKNARVSALMPVNSAIIRNINLAPGQTEEEILESIQAEFKHVGFDETEEIQIACHQMDEDNSQSQQLSFIACAIPDSVVERYRRILNESGLQVKVMDIDALGIYNTYYYFTKKEMSAPVTIVQIGSDYSTCLIMCEGSLPFFHVIKQGGHDITNSIMKNFKLEFFDAEKLKMKETRSKGTEIEFCQNSHVNEFYRTFYDDLITEVQKCIQHFQSYSGCAEIGRLYITGGEARHNIVANLFQRKLHIDVNTWNPLEYLGISNSDNGDTLKFANGLHLAPTIGTLLRGD